MHEDNPSEHAELAAWINARWAPEPSDPQAFLAGLASMRRRRLRSDALGVAALAAAALLFAYSAPAAAPTLSWLDTTSFTSAPSARLPAELLALQSTFLADRARR